MACVFVKKIAIPREVPHIRRPHDPVFFHLLPVAHLKFPFCIPAMSPPVTFPTSATEPVHADRDPAVTSLPALDGLKEFKAAESLAVTPSHDSAHLSSSDPYSSPESIRNSDIFLDEQLVQPYDSPRTDPETQLDDECVPLNTQPRPDVRHLAAQQVLPGVWDHRALRLQLHNLPEPVTGDPAPVTITCVEVPSLSNTRITFDIISRIAEGRVSQVWGAIASSTDASLASFPKHVSIKIVWKGHLYMRADAFGAVWSETCIMKQLAEARVPFVNAALAVWQDENYVYVASPRYTGTLDEYLCTLPYMPSGAPPKVMPPAMFRVYAAELLSAVDDLRAQGIAHCDLKATNVLVSPAGHLTLADFDCSYSGLPTSEHEYWNTRLNSFPGTAEYMAPECVIGQLCSRQNDLDWTNPSCKDLLATPRADMWSLGLVLLQIALQLPDSLFLHCFESVRTVADDWDARIDAMAEILEHWEFEDQLHVHAELYPTVKGFLSKLLTKDPTQRLTAAQAMQEPLFSGLDWDELRAGTLPDGFIEPPLIRQSSDRYNRTLYNTSGSGMELLRASGRGAPPMRAGSHREPVSFAWFNDWVSPAILEDGELPGFEHGETVLVRKDEPCGCERPNCQGPCLYF